MKIPDWMKRQFSKADCSHCHKKLLRSGIKSHGITEELSAKNKKRYTHYYQYICPKCSLETRFRFPTDWQEYISSMVEIAEKEWAEDHPQEAVEGISDMEVENVKKLLDSTEFKVGEDFNAFLSKIGVQTEIEDTEDDENQ
jgi:hypothetical protein